MVANVKSKLKERIRMKMDIRYMFYRGKVIIVTVVFAFLFLVSNILFYKYMISVKQIWQSGEEYIERVEYAFTPEFSDSSDCVVQHFYPRDRYLQSIKIRLGVGDALEDKFIVCIELLKDGKVLCEENVVLYNEDNWRYHELQTEQYVTPGEEYEIRIRQLEGPFKDAFPNQYQYSYTAFIAAKHIEENATQCYFNGEVLPGELETCYIYASLDKNLLGKWIGSNLLVLVTLLLALYVRKISSKTRDCISWIMLGIFPIIIYILCEYALGNLLSIQWQNHIFNIIIYYIIYAVIILVVRNSGVLFLAYSGIMLVSTLGQYFVTLFRGRPLYIYDLLAARTAASVALNYEFQIDDKVFVSLIFCLLITFVGVLWNRSICIGKGKRVCGVGAVIAGIFILFMIRSQWLLSVDMWDISNTYQKGGNLLTLLSQMSYVFMEAPDEYSIDKVEELADIYAKKEYGRDVTPHNIILIMNESFSDLEYINSVQTDTTLLPHWKSLEENAIKGYLYVPVFGAGTANSEYEVLTGNTVEFLRPGSTAYQMNVKENEFGMASILEEQGYKTTALHPCDAANWNRTNVYNYMGFDTFYAFENWGDLEIVRWCASDKSAYEKIIDIDEASVEKQFMFLVTMQNHGGYAGKWDDFTNEITLTYKQEYPEAEQYLSL